MLQLANISLPPATQSQLDTLQQELDLIDDYAAKVEAATDNFSRYNTARNQTFKVIRTKLKQMCSGAQRCGYCEDSCADEVEHIKPKNLYPESTFVWENYLYACGPCNGPKKNQFAIFSVTNREVINVSRRRGDPVVPPQIGDPVLINPRTENPLNFMWLDLQDTFYFVPSGEPDSEPYYRAEYTIRILRLNDRDYLPAARAEAFFSYRARLSEYITGRDRGVSISQLNKLIKALQRMGHPTVWQEMKRHQHLYRELNELFSAAPEALNW